MMEEDNGNQTLKLSSSYAYKERKGLANRFRLGEGLVGECAYEKERILVTDVPDDYIRVNSGLGESRPYNIVVLPVIFEGKVKAVIELASFQRFKDIHLTLLDQLTETIAIGLNTLEANMRTESLLQQSQNLAHELQSQQEELRETNSRLEQQARDLQASEDLLKNRQDELKGANEELQTKARELTNQKTEVEAKNREIELARLALEERAEQLAVTSKYKSEFLASMSHELRTPLNSLLILAEMLASNPDGNLTAKQTDYARTVYSAGSDLLSLINDILDMAKIESGTMPVEVGEILFSALQAYMESTFQPVADTKDLQFSVEVDERLPKAIHTDARRLQQVLRNLLSNAFKFTQDGKVSLRMHVATAGWTRQHPVLDSAGTVLAFSVSDTGIGIARDKLRIVFEPFQQGDTGTARKFGGTGLGLSISREIARLLGGEIRVQSVVGEGSTFTLYLPQTYQAPRGKLSESPVAKPAEVEIGGDYDSLRAGDRMVLIIERDPKFAGVLLEVAHEAAYKAVITPSGETGIALARQLLPEAITLDLRLPDVHGTEVLERLKRDPATRHIPVHVISADETWQRGRKLGAFACLKKPVTKSALDEAFARVRSFTDRGVRNLLVVEDNETERESLMEMFGEGDLRVTSVGTASEALAALRAQAFDCLVLDLRLPDVPGLELLETIKRELGLHNLPVIVYTGRDLTQDDEARLNELAEAVIAKDARSAEPLREKVAMFLHRVEKGRTEPAVPQSSAPELAPGPAFELPRQSTAAPQDFARKKVLVVDDDVRNLFALTSALERWQLVVLRSESGTEALEILKRTPDIDLVLMDIMMPGMDGYETTRRIRKQEQFKNLPIIALTAKALKDDREKCLQAGASDYLAKPVSTTQLLECVRAWLVPRSQQLTV
jgi:CheY-like chemotaxis protein/signal transduction histidine kinase